jgi:hypothetical protein
MALRKLNFVPNERKTKRGQLQEGGTIMQRAVTPDLTMEPTILPQHLGLVDKVQASINNLLVCQACGEPADAAYGCGSCLCCFRCRDINRNSCRFQQLTGPGPCNRPIDAFEHLRSLVSKLTKCSFCGEGPLDATGLSAYGPEHVCPKVPCRGLGCTGVGAGHHHEHKCKVFRDARAAYNRGWIKIRHFMCSGEPDTDPDPSTLSVSAPAPAPVSTPSVPAPVSAPALAGTSSVPQAKPRVKVPRSTQQPPDSLIIHLPSINTCLDDAAAAAADLMDCDLPVRGTKRAHRAGDDDEDEEDSDHTDSEQHYQPSKKTKKRRTDASWQPGRRLPATVHT